MTDDDRMNPALPTVHEDRGQEGPRANGPANSLPAAAGRVLVADTGAIGRPNNPLSLDEFQHQVAEYEANLVRYTFPASQIRVEPDRVIAGDREFPLGDEGFHRLCRCFRAPAPYLSRLNPELRARVLQDHFAHGRYADPKLTDKTSCIVSRGDTFLDLARSDLLTLDNPTVLKAVRDGVGDDAQSLEVRNLRLDDESFVFDVVSPRIAEEVRPGDVLHGGVHVAHSQMDGQATQVLAYVVRLVCANGLVQRQCMGDKRRSTPRARRLSADRPAAGSMQAAQIRRLVLDTWGGLQEKLAAIRRLRDKRIEVKMALERFLRQAHLFSQALMTSLLKAWEEEGGEESAFGALNALTRVATHSPEMPGWQRQRLARLAGVYAGQDVHLCQHCFSILAAR